MHLDNPRNHIVVGNLHLIGAPSQIGPGRETKTKSVNNMACGISLQHQIFAWNIKFLSALFT